ncbi:uncharacterized protein LOC118907518 isoform X2 [Manis pentadactyla]|uniref:uncharacterized protein LOC118907518 isoform X2 n=1 Tax=Manis pentadactyla TaxID=143292 RepID=UPI00255C85ED|nr:uncharacterized protein LOC118907518 isoform X2 [Manis pentadactyla]
MARAGAARAVQSVQRALRRPDVDGSAPCSAAPSSRRACGGGTDLVPRPRIAASRPLGSRLRTRLSRVSRGVRRAAIDQDLEPLPRTDFRELGREAVPAVADLQWRVQSGLYFSGEGYSDSPAGWKLHHHLLQRRKLPYLIPPAARRASRSHRPRRPRPPPADVTVARQSPAPRAEALQQRLPTAGARAPPCQGSCALLTQAWPRSGSSPHPSWSPPLSCATRRCLPLTPALDASATTALQCLLPLMPTLLPSPALTALHCEIPQTRTTASRGPPARDPAPWFPCRPSRLAATLGHSLHREQLRLSEVNS